MSVRMMSVRCDDDDDGRRRKEVNDEKTNGEKADRNNYFDSSSYRYSKLFSSEKADGA